MSDQDKEKLLSDVLMELLYLGEIHEKLVRASVNAYERVCKVDDKNEALDALADLKEEFSELGVPTPGELDRVWHQLSDATKGTS